MYFFKIFRYTFLLFWLVYLVVVFLSLLRFGVILLWLVYYVDFFIYYWKTCLWILRLVCLFFILSIPLQYFILINYLIKLKKGPSTKKLDLYIVIFHNYKNWKTKWNIITNSTISLTKKTILKNTVKQLWCDPTHSSNISNFFVKEHVI